MGRTTTTIQHTPPNKRATDYKFLQQTPHSHASVSRKQRDVSRTTNTALLSQSQHTSESKKAYERFLRHKRAVQMNNYAMTLLDDTELDSAEIIIEALTDAIESMVSVVGSAIVPHQKKIEALLPSAKRSVCAQLFEDITHEKSSAPPSAWSYFVLQIPAMHHYPVDHSQLQEDAAAIMFNLSLVVFALGTKSDSHKWISKGYSITMSLGMMREAKSEASEETNRRQHEMMSANLRETGHLCIDTGVCISAHHYFMLASAIHIPSKVHVGGDGKVLKQAMVTNRAA